jgi:hypothetical protein
MKTAEVIVDFTFESTFNSLNIGDITPTEDELKHMPKSKDANTPIPQMYPTEKPTAKGMQKLTAEKYNTSLPAFFRIENFVSNPLVNMRKTSPRVARKFMTSPGLTHPRPYGPKKTPAKITAVTHGR